MATSFDIFVSAFLNKITSFDYIDMDEAVALENIDYFLTAACTEFEKIFRKRTGFSFMDRDLEKRQFNWQLPDDFSDGTVDYITLDEVVDIISDGMVIRWLKSFLFSGDSLDIGNFVQTKDFSPYSPSNFLNSLQGLYNSTRLSYKQLVNEFSYNHAELRSLSM